MIKLTAEHLQRLVAGSDSMLEMAIANLVREEHGYVVDGLPDDMFQDLVRRGMTTARGYGLQTPQQLATFVLLQFEVGPEFHRHAAIQAVLQDARPTPQEKLDTILNSLPDSVWAECEAALDRQTWYPERRDAAVQEG